MSHKNECQRVLTKKRRQVSARLFEKKSETIRRPDPVESDKAQQNGTEEVRAGNVSGKVKMTHLGK